MDNLTFLFIAIFIFIIILFFLWFFFGGPSTKFEGLSFLNPPSNHSTDFCEIDSSSEYLHESKSSSSISKKEESSVIGYQPLVIPAIKVKLPNLSLSYYENFSLTTKNNSKMNRKNVSESRGEKYCRSILEKFYEKPFPTVRPDFLKSPETNANLELDCFCEELRLALEYNGIQHYVYPNKFHKTEQDFIEQRRRDKYKRDLCSHVGIYLIEVPYTVPHSDLPKYIEYHLPENVQYRKKYGIDEEAEDQLWDLPINNLPKNGYV